MQLATFAPLALELDLFSKKKAPPAGMQAAWAGRSSGCISSERAIRAPTGIQEECATDRLSFASPLCAGAAVDKNILLH